MDQNLSHPFERSGLAALSDLETPAWREVLAELERQQEAFLERESSFRSPDYRWPRDSLHTWSRVWEYPYAHAQLRAHLVGKEGGERSRVVDLGSGVTFFPFAVARLGYRVSCLDVDPICARDLERAAACVESGPGEVEFRLIEGERLPFDDEAVDAVYCISVLEHIPDFEGTVREIARILRPGGKLVVTFDLDVRGDSEIGLEAHRRLLGVLLAHFELHWPEVSVHPADLLQTTNGPYPLPTTPPLQHLRGFVKQRIVKPLLRMKPRRYLPPHLAVQGLTLRRRS
ncbi:MAG: class I SAM-dependent methyltransferase [Deltaproteobacteria bacterium]|nr:class I SAM-dependent methyltransferase [Deltaproteobacteria bacterium]